MTCENGVTVEDKEEINRAYATALKEISDQADQLQKKTGKIWSLIAGNTLKISELEIKLWRTESRERDLLRTYYKGTRYDWYDFGNALNQVNLEVMRNRSQILAENIIKWGNPEVIVTNSDPSDFTPLESLFDVILTDVPCSGEGMFRKDEVAVEEWSPANVGLCWERQRRILRDIWPCLKPGGILIYSTCTFNREENEDNVAWIASELGAEILPVETKEEWKITGNLAGYNFPVYRFLPHRTIGEGLFMAVLRKNGTPDEDYDTLSDYSSRKSSKKNNKKQDKRQNTLTVTDEIKSWICDNEDFEFSIDGTTAVAKPQRLNRLENLLKDKGNGIRILHRGITLAENKGKDWQPHHSLAMSTSLNRESFPQAELSYEQAIAYLRKEAVTLDASIPKGYVLVTYRDTPLGFVKNIGNRANNLYPQEWRIRSGYMPDEVRTVF